MNNSSSSQMQLPPLYEAFGNATGLVPALCLSSGMFFCVALIGVTLNASLIWVTVCENGFRSLRGSANFLLALTAFYQVLNQSFAHAPYFVIAVSGINFVDFETAFWVEWPSLFGTFAAQVALFSTALDRFLSVFIPFKYNRIEPCHMLTVHTLVSTCCGLSVVIRGYLYMLQNPAVPVSGFVQDLLAADSSMENQILTFALPVVSICLYVGIWANVACKHRATGARQPRANHPSLYIHHHNFDLRIFKCLLLNIVVVLGSYLVIAVQSFFSQLFSNNTRPNNLGLYLYLGIFVNIGTSANAPILYAFSTDYHEAFRRHLIDPLLRRHRRRMPLLHTAALDVQQGSPQIRRISSTVSMRNRVQHSSTSFAATPTSQQQTTTSTTVTAACASPQNETPTPATLFAAPLFSRFAHTNTQQLTLAGAGGKGEKHPPSSSSGPAVVWQLSLPAQTHTF